MTSSLRSQIGRCTWQWEGVILTPGEGLRDWPSSCKSHDGVGSVEESQSKTTEVPTVNPGLNEREGFSRIAEKGKEKSIEIDLRVHAGPVAFVADGDYIVGDDGNEIRRWRVKDGKEVCQPMDAGNVVRSIAVSRDGKWIVNGADEGHVTVWNAKSHKKAIGLREHKGLVLAVDISPDGTRFATGSLDCSVCVWLLSTGEKLLGPFRHNFGVAAVKYSPDGRHIATATWERDSVRIYDSQDGRLLVDTPIQVGSLYNQSLAWTGSGKELFALSEDGYIHCIHVATGTTLSKWAIHGHLLPRCISLARDGGFIAASAESSVSFWDITTHHQIGPLIHHPTTVFCLAISANHDLAISGGMKMVLQTLPDILPSFYFDHVRVISPMPDANETLFAANYLQLQPEALPTSTEERYPEETVSFHRTKNRGSSKSSPQGEPVQHLAIKELSPPKTGKKEGHADAGL